MSKLIEKYNELKKADSDKLYLFKSGKFYIFLCDDADYIDEYVVLKKTLFTKDKYKCGFPEERLKDYLRVFQNHNLNIELVEEINKENNVTKLIKDIDINNITPFEALVKLNEIKELIDD